MSRLESAIALACRVHAGQVDKSGQAYILHPLRLMLQFDNEDERIVSVLHDVVEDGGVTFDQLRQLGLSDAIVGAIDCLSKRPEEDYDAFIARLASNPLARKVKMADIKHNLDVVVRAIATVVLRQRTYRAGAIRLGRSTTGIGATGSGEFSGGAPDRQSKALPGQPECAHL